MTERQITLSVIELPWSTKKALVQIEQELSGRGDKIRTCDLCVPNAALYQTEPHLEVRPKADLNIIVNQTAKVKRNFRKNKLFKKNCKIGGYSFNNSILKLNLRKRAAERQARAFVVKSGWVNLTCRSIPPARAKCGRGIGPAANGTWQPVCALLP